MPTDLSRVARECAAAGIAGAAADGLFNPTAVLQVRGQIEPSASMIQLARRAVQRGGGVFHGLWLPGLKANCWRAFTYTGFRVGTYATARDALPGHGSFANRVVAGALTGAVGATTFAPIEHVRVRMAGSGSCNSMLLTARGIVQESGLTGLWRGCGPFALRCSCYSGSQLACYDVSKRWLLTSGVAGPVEGAWLHLAASGVAGVCATLVCHPLDTIKTLVMHQGTVGTMGDHARPILLLMRELAGRGVVGAVRCLYGGLLPALLSRGPMVMVFFPLAEQLRTRLFGLDYI